MEKKCVKCGFEGLHIVKYEEPVIEIVSQFNTTIEMNEYEVKIVRKERLGTTCGECGYKTHEPCKDAPKETRIN